MARITVDDCLKNVTNRFELVHIVAERSRQLDIGGHKTLLEDNEDKCTLIALREVAEGLVDKDILYNHNINFAGVLDDGQDVNEAIKQVAQKELQVRQERKEQEEAEVERGRTEAESGKESQATSGAPGATERSDTENTESTVVADDDADSDKNAKDSSKLEDKAENAAKEQQEREPAKEDQ